MTKRAVLTVKEAGARGGKVRGPAKRRGDSGHYRQMAQRKWKYLDPPADKAVRDAAGPLAEEAIRLNMPVRLPLPPRRKRIRERSRVAVGAIAKLCEVTRQTIYAWEKGTEPANGQRALYAAVLGLLESQGRRSVKVTGHES